MAARLPHMGIPIQIRLAQPIRDRIRALAERDGTTEVAIIRQLIASALEARGQLAPVGGANDRRVSNG